MVPDGRRKYMPKVNLIWSAEPQYKALTSNIKICMYRTGIDALTLAKLLGVCRSSLYKKISQPEKMQYEEICRLAHIFKVDTADLIREGGV